MLNNRMMASLTEASVPTYRSSTSAKTPNATDTSLTISTPAGVANGDVLLAFFRSGNVTTFTPPSGWTQIAYNSTVVSQSISIVAYSKTASSEPSSYTFSRSTNSSFMEGVIVAASGASSTITTGSVNSQFATSLVAQSISLSAPSLVFAVYHWGLSPIISTAPSGMSVANTDTNNDGTNGTTVAYYVTETGSTSGDKTLVVNTTAEGKSYLIGLYGA